MNKIINKIKNSNKIGIAAHVSPDGDAVGSVISFAEGLRSLGKDVTILSKDQVPSDFDFLSLYEEYNQNLQFKDDLDILIAVDTANLDRLSVDLEKIKGIFLINIDHHISNDMYGDLNFVVGHAASASEIVYKFLRKLKVDISKDMADALYTGIASDSGSFRFPSTSPETHLIVSEILKTGIDFSKIHRDLFGTKSFYELKVLGIALSSMSSFNDGETNILSLSHDDMSLTDPINSDLGFIVNYGLMPKESEVAVLFKETSDGYKVSVRTKNYINASELCAEFGGGGHARAAGCFIKDHSLSDSKRMILEAIERIKKS